eukprot:GHVH01012051.1.p1 GENE.GHVH01012051.1~~GHVH01012051.1.p1  ORF type:complete len:643 (+),score=53.43 GHVH01012051.1:77-2005(+)
MAPYNFISGASPLSPRAVNNQAAVWNPATGQCAPAPGANRVAPEYKDDNLSHVCPLHCGLITYNSLNTRLLHTANPGVSLSKREVEKSLRRIHGAYDQKSESKNAASTEGPSDEVHPGQEMIDDLIEQQCHQVQDGNTLSLYDLESPLRIPPLCRCSKHPERIDTWRQRIKELKGARDGGSKSVDTTTVPPVCPSCGHLSRFPLTFISIQTNREIPDDVELARKVPLPRGLVVHRDPDYPMSMTLVCFTVEQERMTRGSLQYCGFGGHYQVYDVCSQHFAPYLDASDRRNPRFTIKLIERYCYRQVVRQEAKVEAQICSLISSLDNTTDHNTAMTLASRILTCPNLNVPWISLCEAVPVNMDERGRLISNGVPSEASWHETALLSDFVAELRPISPNPENLVHLISLHEVAHSSPEEVQSADHNAPGLASDAFRVPATPTSFSWTSRPYCIRPRTKMLVSKRLSNPSLLQHYLKCDPEVRAKVLRIELPAGVDGVIPLQSCYMRPPGRFVGGEVASKEHHQGEARAIASEIYWEWNPKADNGCDNTEVVFHAGSPLCWLDDKKMCSLSERNQETSENDRFQVPLSCVQHNVKEVVSNHVAMREALEVKLRSTRKSIATVQAEIKLLKDKSNMLKNVIKKNTQ